MGRTIRHSVLACFAAGLLGVAIAEAGMRTPAVWLGVLAVALGGVFAAWLAKRGTVVACGIVCVAAFGARAALVTQPAFPPGCNDRADEEKVADEGADADEGKVADEGAAADERRRSDEGEGADESREGWDDLKIASSASGSRERLRRFRATIDGPIGRERAPSDGMQLRAPLRLRAEACHGRWAPVDARVVATLGTGDVPLGIGDEIELSLDLKPLPPRRTTAGIAPEDRARRQQIVGTARSDVYALVSPGWGLTASLERWRQRTAVRFEAALPPSTQALAKALATGDQLDIDQARRQAWADAGTAHLLSVSGLHVALVALLLLAVARATVQRMPWVIERWGRSRATVALTVPGVVAYGLVTGGSSAAWRATLMACALLIARSMRRTLKAADALGGAGMVLLAVSPMAVYDPGFWLSFVAVGALLAIPKQRISIGRWDKLRGSVRMGLIVSLTASVATAPLTAWYFGRISLMGPLTNLVAAPVGSWIATPLALALALIGPASEAMTRIIAWPLHHVLHALDLLSIHAAALPFAAFDVSLPRITWSKVAGLLVVQHLYVGHGDATLVRMPHGETMLVDGGGAIGNARDPADWAVIPALRAAGIERIDIMVATHPHPDHINGLVAVAERYDVGEFWYNGTGASLPVMGSLIDTLRTRGAILRTSVSLPDRAMRGDVIIERLHPRPPVEGMRSANDNSIVLRLQYGARSILLTGDIEAWAESQLAEHLQRVDIMKVPHHGSRTSSSATLLRAAQPQLAVVSCGADNRWGFPHTEVQERYRAASIPLWRTDTHGEITSATDGTTWTVTNAGTGAELRLQR